MSFIGLFGLVYSIDWVRQRLDIFSVHQCDDTHQNPVDVRPVKNRSDSVERSTWKEEWFRNERPSKRQLRLCAEGGVV